MNGYYLYMAEQIADEINSVDDPAILHLWLRAIVAQRCKIGEAKQDTCKGCMFQSCYCRQLYEVCKIEEKEVQWHE